MIRLIQITLLGNNAPIVWGGPLGHIRDAGCCSDFIRCALGCRLGKSSGGEKDTQEGNERGVALEVLVDLATIRCPVIVFMHQFGQVIVFSGKI